MSLNVILVGLFDTKGLISCRAFGVSTIKSVAVC